jgi:hypothetical protein
MAQSAVVRDYRQLKIGRRRANRLVLTVTGMSTLAAGWRPPVLIRER